MHEDACAAWLLETAAREAVSAFAFEDVGKCLGELGLAELARACERAAHEERLHAALLGELLHERGLTPLEVHVFAPKQRTLVDLAADNAREGCVREAFGALVARHQAAHAKDARLAAVLDTIATDEAGHAELSHRIHDALWARLSAQERRQVLAARAEAMASLAGDCANAHGSSLLGHPEASTMVVLFERFAALAA